jgi:hypothetical protein
MMDDFTLSQVRKRAHCGYTSGRSSWLFHPIAAILWSDDEKYGVEEAEKKRRLGQLMQQLFVRRNMAITRPCPQRLPFMMLRTALRR